LTAKAALSHSSKRLDYVSGLNIERRHIMVTTLKRYSWLLLVFLPFMLGIETCGLRELVGTKESRSPTAPCFDLVPTPAPTPTPTPTPEPEPEPEPTPTLTPEPKPKPTVTPVLTPIVTPVPTITPTPTLTPTPTPTPIPNTIYVNNSIPACLPSALCGLVSSTPCCNIQDGVDTAYSSGRTRVLVSGGPYNLGPAPIGVYSNSQGLLIEATGVVQVNAFPGYSAFSITSSMINEIRGFALIQGNVGGMPAITINASGGTIYLRNNTIDGFGAGTSGIACLSLAAGTVSLDSNTFDDSFATTGALIACTGGALTSNNNNSQLNIALTRNTSACAPSILCMSPPCSTGF